MRFKLLCILIGVAFGALGVARAQEAGWHDWPSYPPDPWKPRQFNPEEVYTKTRYIGVLDKRSRDCPAVPLWTVERLLDVAVRRDPTCEPWQPGPEDRALIRDLGLDRFCVYTTDKARPFTVPKGIVAKPDRMALSASANDLEMAVWKPLADTFESRTGAETAFGMRGAPSVRLAILDSQPDSEDIPLAPPAGSQHGYTLMHLARKLACPTPSRCAARIVSHRALGYVGFAAGEPLSPFQAGHRVGGHVGTVSELATAIFAEVLQWRHQGSPGHLILNLSLGWDGELFRDLDASSVSQLDPDVRYVYKALRFAARRGVLVIAAAGNQKGGQPGSEWPLLPAAWEMRRPSWCPLLSHRRLVYSVGGVDWQGLPLPNSRQGGRPERAAYGDHAVVDRGDDQPTAIYTGSSVSAAVVSSIAAVVWHLRPELRPDQVMRLIDGSGQLRPARADFYPWRTIWLLDLLLPRPQLRQVSLCAAVEHACGRQAGARCPALEAPPESCKLAQGPPLIRLPPPETTASFVAEGRPFPEQCGRGRQLFRPDPPPDPDPGLDAARICPSRLFGSVTSRRWNFPQPDIVPCPGCSLDPPSRMLVTPVGTVASLSLPQVAALGSKEDPGDILADQPYTLRLQISDSWKADHLGREDVLLPDATLDVDCYDGATTTSQRIYRFRFDTAAAGLQSFPDISHGASLKGCTAQINFVVTKGDGTTMSVQNPVVVVTAASGIP